MPAASPGYDLRLVDGDIPLQNGGFITGTALTIQRLPRRLKTNLGEVLTDRFAGIDLLGWLQVRPPDLALMEGAIRVQVDTCPGVARCGRIDSAFDKASKAATFDVAAVLITGESVQIGVDMGTNGNPAISVLVLTPQAMLA